MTESTSHNFWMEKALKEAEKSFSKEEVPVGAIIVLDGEIIGKGNNQPILKKDPTSHAEINAIRNATKKVGNYRLTGATLHTTLEPCAMCYGAIIHARISRLVFGAYDPKTGVCGSSIKLHEQECFNHSPEIIGGVLEKDCSLILKDFFKERRN